MKVDILAPFSKLESQIDYLRKIMTNTNACVATSFSLTAPPAVTTEKKDGCR